MLSKDVLNLLGLAMRSRNIVTGDSVLKSIRNQTSKLVIIAQDASDNTKKQLTDKCTHYKIEYIIVGDSQMISQAIGKNNRKAISIINENFANKIKEKIG